MPMSSYQATELLHQSVLITPTCRQWESYSSYDFCNCTVGKEKRWHSFCRWYDWPHLQCYEYRCCTLRFGNLWRIFILAINVFKKCFICLSEFFDRTTRSKMAADLLKMSVTEKFKPEINCRLLLFLFQMRLILEFFCTGQ